MANAPRRSLSKQEHAIRLRFDAATRDGEGDLRARLWTELKEARRKAAREKERLVVRIRLKERSKLISSCLIADLVLLPAPPRSSRATPPHRIDAYVSCELLLDAELPPCGRPGRCPHELVVLVLESDNDQSPLEKSGWAALRDLTGR